MKFDEILNKRQSCRSYSTKPVEKEKLISLIEAAKSAPSACNSQPVKYVVVNDNDTVEKMPELMEFNKFTKDVRAFIVVCETKAKLMKRATCDSQFYAQMDIGLAVANITLKATEQGLSTCIMGCFDDKGLKELLSIPEETVIRLVISVGYSKDEKIRDKSRKDFNEICSFNKW